MTFPLTEIIYNNLEVLDESGVLPSFQNCGPSGYQYIALRIFPTRSIETAMEHVQNSPVGDEKFKAYRILTQLVQHLETNTQDGLYWVAITDNNLLHDINGNEVICHFFLLEKSNEKLCLIQTYLYIGGRQICGIPLCGVEKGEIANRISGIIQLLNTDSLAFQWTQEDWNSWLDYLALPHLYTPESLQITNPRALWQFIPLTTKGCLFALYEKISSRIPHWILKSNSSKFSQRSGKYSELVDILSQIEQISEGEDYLDNNRRQLFEISQEIDQHFSEQFFDTLN
ncbi:hypothetical protein pv_231 [Pithovirus sibericum]|uniref:Uncharacterized protein n=1 Tax=Pithovirus sibericum TaxID=1450746 RepID=W5S4V5_9VIRU|nr:hypothetical protein pv_231 [Pithovirus sibericum]AHH01798.1 hypothetical protein pv_231 [Pithovirus sibericum]